MSLYYDIDFIMEIIENKLDEAKQEILNLENEVPSADVVEVKHGEWKLIRTNYFIDGWSHKLYECSICGRQIPTRDNFCPNCGADMRGDKETQ